MRILYLHQHFSTPNGSTGIRSYEMARHLISRGHAVTMVCGSYNGAETGLMSQFVGGSRRGVVDGIDIIEFDLAYSNSDGFIKRTFTFVRFSLSSIKLVFTQKYDLVFATSTPLTAGIPGLFARWILRKPFVFEVRDLWPELPKAMGVICNPFVLSLMSILEWVTYRSAHRLIGLSPGIVQGIIRRGVPHDRVAMVPNGCDLGIFSGAMQPWRPDCIDPGHLMAVFAGTHGVANGLDAVLDVALELKRRGRKDINILLIGQGKLKSALQARAKREELDNVIFHDSVNKTKLASLMMSADIGLQVLANVPAFYYGTSPNKFFDYIAARLPVINNYPGWLAEMICEHECGFAVPGEDPVAFANALERAADDRDLLRLMGQRSRALAEGNFSRYKLASQWVDWVTGVRL